MEQITDHEARALARLLEQFKNKAHLASLIKAFAAEVQALEDSTWGLLAGRSLAAAVGEQLDGAGALVGQPRAGMTDDSYRLHIRVRRLLNRSSGTGPELLRIFGLLVSGSQDLVLEEQVPAAIVLRVAAAALGTPSDFLSILRQAKDGGIRALLEFQTGTDATTFSFFEDPTGLGFADGTVGGGNFAQALE